MISIPERRVICLLTNLPQLNRINRSVFVISDQKSTIDERGFVVNANRYSERSLCLFPNPFFKSRRESACVCTSVPVAKDLIYQAGGRSVGHVVLHGIHGSERTDD